MSTPTPERVKLAVERLRVLQERERVAAHDAYTILRVKGEGDLYFEADLAYEMARAKMDDALTALEQATAPRECCKYARWRDVEDGHNPSLDGTPPIGEAYEDIQ